MGLPCLHQVSDSALESRITGPSLSLSDSLSLSVTLPDAPLVPGWGSAALSVALPDSPLVPGWGSAALSVALPDSPLVPGWGSAALLWELDRWNPGLRERVPLVSHTLNKKCSKFEHFSCYQF